MVTDYYRYYQFSTLFSDDSKTDTDGLFRGKQKVDEKGFRVPYNPALQLDNMTTHDTLLMLKRRIIYNNGEILNYHRINSIFLHNILYTYM